MSFVTCTHVHERGVYCGSPAVSGQRYCYQHLRQEGRRLRAARARLEHKLVPIDIPPLEDYESILVGLMEMTSAILEARVNRKDAGMVLYALSQARNNMTLMEQRNAREERSLREQCASDNEAPVVGVQEPCTEYESYLRDYALDKPLPAEFKLVTPADAARRAYREKVEEEERTRGQNRVALDPEMREKVERQMEQARVHLLGSCGKHAAETQPGKSGDSAPTTTVSEDVKRPATASDETAQFATKSDMAAEPAQSEAGSGTAAEDSGSDTDYEPLPAGWSPPPLRDYSVKPPNWTSADMVPQAVETDEDRAVKAATAEMFRECAEAGFAKAVDKYGAGAEKCKGRKPAVPETGTSVGAEKAKNAS